MFTEPKEKKEEKKEEEEKQTLETLVTLKGLKLEVKKGEFMCIIGDVGSGKSSILSALIGEMLYVSNAQVEKFSYG